MYLSRPPRAGGVFALLGQLYNGGLRCGGGHPILASLVGVRVWDEDEDEDGGCVCHYAPLASLATLCGSIPSSLRSSGL